MSPEEARYAARRAFGNATFIKEEVLTYDVPTLIGAGTTLAATALLAAFAPARRASRVDPMTALKYE